MKLFSNKKTIIGIINATDNVSVKALNIISTTRVNTENLKLGSKNFNILFIIFIWKNSI